MKIPITVVEFVQAQALGELHYQGGIGVPIDYQRGFQYLQNAFGTGNPVALAFLGRLSFSFLFRYNFYDK